MGIIASARIGKPRGAKGALWLELYLAEGLPCAAGDSVLLGSEESSTQSFLVEECFEYQKGVVLKLKGVDDPGAASALIGQWLYVDADKLNEGAEDTFDIQGVVGYRVLDVTRGLIGSITGTREGKAYWVFIVKGSKGLIEIPAVKGLGVTIDESEMTVHTDLPLKYPNLDEETDAN